MKKCVLLTILMFVLTISASTMAFAISYKVPKAIDDAHEKMCQPLRDKLDDGLATVVGRILHKQMIPGKKNPLDCLVKIKLKNPAQQGQIKFDPPPKGKLAPKVAQMMNVMNCDPTKDQTNHLTVRAESQNTETFAVETTLGGETSVSLSYQSPLGVGGSATQSFNYSTTNTKETSKTDTLGWEQSVDVIVGPLQKKSVQFVIWYQNLKKLPWSADVTPKGQAELMFRMATGALYAVSVPQIEKYIPTPITIKGTYEGTIGVQGDVKDTPPEKVTSAECKSSGTEPVVVNDKTPIVPGKPLMTGITGKKK